MITIRKRKVIYWKRLIMKCLSVSAFLTAVTTTALLGQTKSEILSGYPIALKIQYGNMNFKKLLYDKIPDIGTAYGWDMSCSYFHSTGTNFLPGIGFGIRRVSYNKDIRDYYIVNDFWHARIKVFIQYKLYTDERMMILPGITFVREWNLKTDNIWRSKNPFEYPFYLYPKGLHLSHKSFGGEHLDAELTGLYRIGMGFAISVSAAYNVYDRAVYRLKEFRYTYDHFAAEYSFPTGLSVNAGIAYVIKL